MYLFLLRCAALRRYGGVVCSSCTICCCAPCFEDGAKIRQNAITTKTNVCFLSVARQYTCHGSG